MKNYLNISIIIFLSSGIFLGLGTFALKIIFQEDIYNEVVVLGPDKKDIIRIPKDVSGKKISNLDIEILNNKKALVTNEKLRLPPAEPELLPLDLIEENVSVKSNNKKRLNNNVLLKVKNKSKKPKKIEKKINKQFGLYRVQFGSFRNLEKAQVAKDNMNKKFEILLSSTELEIYSYTNNENLVFHRVWTSPLSKINGLDLCNKFREQKIVCILQVNK